LAPCDNAAPGQNRRPNRCFHEPASFPAERCI
jgi:hypothetical protein